MFSIEYNPTLKKSSLFFNDTKIAIWNAIEQKAVEVTTLEYIRIFGYMAAYRAEWNNGNRINWTENLRVPYPHGYPINITIVQA